jgi:hypothetical protein
MLRLPQGATVIRTLEKLAIEDHGGLEARSMVRSLSDACVSWQVEAAPLSKLLQLILVHTCSSRSSQLENISSSIFSLLAVSILAPAPAH